jgi:hypothetical protein
LPPLVEFELDYLPEFTNQGARRPYLWLELTGPNGAPQRVRGIVDTGADRSSLPAWYAVAFGLDPAHVQAGQGRQVSGSTFPVFTWPVKIRAVVVGALGYEFELDPTYVPGATQPLWGRKDFLALWEFQLDERGSKFSMRSHVQA